MEDDELPEDLRQRADEVLAQRKFRADEPSLLDRAWNRFTEFLSDLLRIVTDNTAFGGVQIGWILLAVMLGLIVFFLVRYLPRTRMARAEKATATVDMHRNRMTRREWLAEAEKAEQAGLHREAVRARYRATVAGLVEADELPDDPGATVTELRDSFEAEPARSDPFSDSTGAFSDVWYGGEDADTAAVDDVARWDREVVEPRSGGR